MVEIQYQHKIGYISRSLLTLSTIDAAGTLERANLPTKCRQPCPQHTISGTPTTAGTSNFTVSAQDSSIPAFADFDAAGMAMSDNAARFIKRQFPQLSPADCVIAAGTLERANLPTKCRQPCPQHTNYNLFCGRKNMKHKLQSLALMVAGSMLLAAPSLSSSNPTVCLGELGQKNSHKIFACWKVRIKSIYAVNVPASAVFLAVAEKIGMPVGVELTAGTAETKITIHSYDESIDRVL
ncbi:MAG: hypothetical protein NT018_05565 [Armatimonadetes bacterium]|nr:hypothetical protein [Armatimonadota bacterium]